MHSGNFNSATLLPHILRAENFDMYYWHLGDDEHVCEAGWQLGTLMQVAALVAMPPIKQIKTCVFKGTGYSVIRREFSDNHIICMSTQCKRCVSIHSSPLAIQRAKELKAPIPIILVWTHFDSKTAEKLQVQFGRKQAMRQAHFLLLLLFACTSLKRMIDTLIIDTSIMGGGKRKSTCTCNIGTMSVAREHHIDMYVQD